MSDPVPSSAISDATVGGLSVIIVTGGSTGDVLTRQSNGTYLPVTPASGGVGGSTGSTDNRLLRSDGTGGATVQASTATLDDTGNMILPGSLKLNGSGNDSALIKSDGSLGLQFYWQLSGTPGKGVGMAYESFLPISGMKLGESGYGWPELWMLGNGKFVGSSSTIAVSGPNATFVPICIKGAASQSANLSEWQNSSATVLAAIRSNGAIKPAALANSAAANDSIYYSTDAEKLVYKDSSGTVNNLY